MRHLLAAVVVVLLGVNVGVASARDTSDWYINKTNHDYECNHHPDEDFTIGPFSSLEACQAFLGASSGQVCSDGETLNVAWPSIYVYTHEGVTPGACESGGGGDGGGDGGGGSAGGASHPASVAPPRSPDESFLCYSVGGDVYTASSPAQAAVLEAAGYWLPTAVAGNVAGGTNVGSFHLACMTPGTLGVGGNAPLASEYVGETGERVDHPADENWIGVYPVQGS
jgi:hypothetical protein